MRKASWSWPGIGALLAGCSLLTGPSQAATPQAVTPLDKAFALSRGATFSVVLEGHGTAGYEWTLMDDYDRGVVALSTKSLDALPANAPIGASANEIFVFSTVGPGSTVLNFQDLRPWEATPSTQPFGASFSVTVH